MLLDRVQDTTTSTGTGVITNSGSAPFNKVSLSGAGYAVGQWFEYVLVNRAANEWEVGQGQYLGSNQWQRFNNLVTADSQGTPGSVINFSAGTKDFAVVHFANVFAGSQLVIAPDGTTGIPGTLFAHGNGLLSQLHVGIGTGAVINNIVFAPGDPANQGQSPFQCSLGISENLTGDLFALGTPDGLAIYNAYAHTGGTATNIFAADFKPVISSLSTGPIGLFGGNNNFVFNYGSGNITRFVGAWGNPTHSGVGTVTTLAALFAEPQITTGIATNFYGVHARPDLQGGTATTVAAFVADAINGTATTVTSLYGLLLTDYSGYAGATNKYNLYSQGVNALHNFEGVVGIGQGSAATLNTVLNVARTLTIPPGAPNIVGISNGLTLTGTGAQASNFGINSAITNTGSGNFTQLYGSNVAATHQGSGVGGDVVGGLFSTSVSGASGGVGNVSAGNFSTQTNRSVSGIAAGCKIDTSVNTSGTIGNLLGLYVTSPSISGGPTVSFTTAGILIADWSGLSGAYNIYSAGASTNNKFEGSHQVLGHVAIGGAATVNGNIIANIQETFTGDISAGRTALYVAPVFSGTNVPLTATGIFSDMTVAGTSSLGTTNFRAITASNNFSSGDTRATIGGNFEGLFVQALQQSAAAINQMIVAEIFAYKAPASGNVANIFGIVSTITANGTVSNQVASSTLSLSLGASSALTTQLACGLFVQSPIVGGTVTINNVAAGAYIADQSNLSGAFNIYSAGTASVNKFEGDFVIGGRMAGTLTVLSLANNFSGTLTNQVLEVVLDGTSSITTGTYSLPGNPRDGQRVRLTAAVTIVDFTLNVAAASGHVTKGANTTHITFAAGACLTSLFWQSNTTWYIGSG